MGFLRGAGIIGGLAVGLGVSMLAPRVGPHLRPIGKSVLKAGLRAYDEAQVAIAELIEKADDVIAEARAEMEAEQARASRQPSKEDKTDIAA